VVGLILYCVVVIGVLWVGGIDDSGFSPASCSSGYRVDISIYSLNLLCTNLKSTIPTF